MRPVSRRVIVLGALGGVAVAGWTRDVLAAESDGSGMTKQPSALYLEAREKLAAGRAIKTERVKLELPRLAESGNSVTLKVLVDSPMTADDHVKVIHLLSEQNPIATIGRFHLSARSGRGEVSTSIRLAGTQYIHAIAEMSNGALYEAAAESVVLMAACIDGG
jgi:sulfur-oxidizing protein SoxY